jgi:hypothetical protein
MTGACHHAQLFLVKMESPELFVILLFSTLQVSRITGASYCNWLEKQNFNSECRSQLIWSVSWI